MKPQRLVTKAAENMPYGIRLDYELTEGEGGTDGSATLTTSYGQKTHFTLEVKTVHRMETLSGVERRTLTPVNSMDELFKIDADKLTDAIVRQTSTECAEVIEQICLDFWTGLHRE